MKTASDRPRSAWWHRRPEGSGPTRPPGAAGAGIMAEFTPGELIRQVAVRAGELGVELVDVAGNVDAVSERITAQAQTFAGLRSDADGMRTDNRGVAAAAANVREATHQAASEVHRSQQALQSSLHGLRGLVDWAETAGGQMQDLAKQVEDIGRIAREVETIARSTHVLALNASIEASRAGASGRGFAVIASSVRQLADQTIQAASDIDGTLGALADQIRTVAEDGTAAREHAQAAQRDLRSIGETISTVDTTMVDVDGQVSGIAEATGLSGEKVDRLVDSLVELAGGVERSSDELDLARGRVNNLLGQIERLIGMTTRAGVPTADTALITIAQDAARRVEELFAEAVAAGRIAAADLFTQEYRPVAGTDPEQFTTAFTELTDEAIRPHLDEVRASDPQIRFVVIANLDGYVPTHHPDYAQPQRSDPVWNDAHCRNRRFFLGRTELTGARNSEPYLLQTYRRPMGGGRFTLMKDVAVPIRVDGRQWGGLRIGYVTGAT